MKLTKGQKEFIGTTFPTPKGGVLTVTGLHSGGKNSRFFLHCSICSEDKELWTEGSIKIVKGTLVSGVIPCGCALNPKWTEDQTKIRVERVCEKRGYVFNGWVGGYKGNTTKLCLYNPKTGNCWKSTIVSSFLDGCGDPVEGAEGARQSKVVPDEQHIKAFIKTGCFKEGTKFWRSGRLNSQGRKSYWYYTCPVCSNDEYVKNGLCEGVFEGNVSCLKKGALSCRCGKNYHWTQQQREYQLQNTWSDQGFTFKGWSNKTGYTNAYSKFKWVCNKGHNCETSVTCFLDGRRCMECRKQEQKESGIVYGYYPKRTEEQDNLYLIHFKPQNCIKVGRAFDVEKRLKGTTGLLKSSGCTREEIEILQVLTGTHQEVYETEQWLQDELTDRGFYHEESTWTTETFDEDCLQLLYKLVDESGLVDGEW